MATVCVIPTDTAVETKQTPPVESWPGGGASATDHTLVMRLLLIACSSVGIFYSLGSVAIRAWDEGIYAEIAREMLRGGHWLTPYWNFAPWFEKPPLFMWLQLLTYRLLGVSEFSARAVTALCGVACVWLTFEIGRKLMGNWAGLSAAAVLGVNANFIYSCRQGTMDVPLTACFAAVAYTYLKTKTNPRWYYPLGFLIGVALLLKGLGGVPALIAVVVAMLLDPSGVSLNTLFKAAIPACALAVPWHLGMVILHGRSFLNEYFGYHVIARLRGIEGHDERWFYYFLLYWHVFLVFAIVACMGLLLYLCGQASREFSVVISFVVVITLAYSFVGTKLPQYSEPAFPFIALFAALPIHVASRWQKRASLCGAVLLFSLAGYFQIQPLKDVYRAWSDYTYDLEPLRSLLVMSRAGTNDSSHAPLIVCLDSIFLEKQVPLFYAQRPIVQAFVAEPPLRRGPVEQNMSVRYIDPVPLDRVVVTSPMPIIVGTWNYPQIVGSELYAFAPRARRGQLILGWISRAEH